MPPQQLIHETRYSTGQQEQSSLPVYIWILPIFIIAMDYLIAILGCKAIFGGILVQSGVHFHAGLSI